MMPRRTILGLIAASAVLLALLRGANAQPADEQSRPSVVLSGPKATVEPAKRDVEIGEVVDLRIDLPVDEGDFASITIELPENQGLMSVIGEARKLGPRSFSVPLRLLNPGSATLGPMTIKAVPEGAQPVAGPDGKETLPSIPFNGPEIAFAVAEPAFDISAETKDFTAPLEEPFDYFWRNVIIAAAALVGLLFLGAIGALLIWLIAREAERRRYVPPVPPVDAALGAVRSLKSLELYAEMGPERHYTVLSSALRRYFEDQFVVSAMEMSEDEVVDFLFRDLSHLQSAESLVELLRRSSMAKYARESLTADVAAADCDVAEGFLLGEKQRLAQERLRAAAQGAQTPPSGGGAADDDSKELNRAA